MITRLPPSTHLGMLTGACRQTSPLLALPVIFYLQLASLTIGSLGNNVVLYNQWGRGGNIWAPSRPCSLSKLVSVVFGCPKQLSPWSRMKPVVPGRGGGGGTCNMKLPAEDLSRAALVVYLIIQTILFCFSK